MDKEKRLKITGLSDDDKNEIRRKALKELDPVKYNDSYISFMETSRKHFDLCVELIKKASLMVSAHKTDEARTIIEKCIFDYNTVQPEAYYIAAKIIDDKKTLNKIIVHYESNSFLFGSKKLKHPIEEIRSKHDHNLSLNELNVRRVQTYVRNNPGLNKTRLHSGLRNEYGWYHQPTTEYIEKAIEDGLIVRQKKRNVYKHWCK